MIKLLILFTLSFSILAEDFPHQISPNDEVNSTQLMNNFNHTKKRFLVKNIPSEIKGDDSGVGYAYNIYSFQLKPSKTYRVTMSYDLLVDSGDGWAIRICQGVATPTTSESSTTNGSCNNNSLPVVYDIGGSFAASSNYDAGNSSQIHSEPRILTTPNTGSNITYTVQMVSLANDSSLRKATLTIEEDNQLEEVSSLVD